MLADCRDARDLRDKLLNSVNPSLILYKEIEAGHNTFNMGKKVDVWKNDILPVLKKFKDGNGDFRSQYPNGPEIVELPLFDLPSTENGNLGNFTDNLL